MHAATQRCSTVRGFGRGLWRRSVASKGRGRQGAAAVQARLGDWASSQARTSSAPWPFCSALHARSDRQRAPVCSNERQCWATAGSQSRHRGCWRVPAKRSAPRSHRACRFDEQLLRSAADERVGGSEARERPVERELGSGPLQRLHLLAPRDYRGFLDSGRGIDTTVDSQSEGAIAHLIEESCSLKRSVDALLGPEESRCRGEAALADRA